MDADGTTTVRVAGVRFHDVGKVYHFDVTEYPELSPGDHVIVETTRGRQLGQIMSFVPPERADMASLKPVKRPATARDLVMRQSWAAKELDALITCREKAAQLGGLENAKFIQASYNYDGTRLAIHYTAEQRANTTTLRKQLSRTLRVRVELRQIGPRDAAKMLGGYGACGIPRCCSTFLTTFSPISIKMAKSQGISLDPSEITGMCGRLRCCLLYEYEQYVEARKHLPRLNKRVGTPHGEGKVIDVQPLEDSVTVLVEDTRYQVHRDDIQPLEELRALQGQSSKGCGREGKGKGGCECGRRDRESE